MQYLESVLFLADEKNPGILFLFYFLLGLELLIFGIEECD